MSSIKINKIVSALRKKFGAESTALMSDPAFHSNPPYAIPTQCLGLDLAIGRPGLPGGRIIEISGLEGHGKSTLGEHLLAEVQRMGGVASLIETEHGRDYHRVQKIGVDPEALLVSQPETLEQGFSMIEETIRTVRQSYPKVPMMILWDSIAATQSEEEKDDNYDDAHMANHARIIAQALRKLVPIFARQRITMVFINQLKSKLSTGWAPPGDNLVTFGGKAIAYMSSVTIRVKRRDFIKSGSEILGFVQQAKIVKNKVGPPHILVEYPIRYATGLDRQQEMLDSAVDWGLLKAGKGVYTFKKETFKKTEWAEFVKRKGGVDKMYRLLLKRALKRHEIVPYGVESSS